MSFRMSSTSSDTSLTLDTGENAKRRVWLETYYFNIPLNILNMTPNTYYRLTKVKPTYIDFFLEFQFQRISELHFKIVCTREPVHDSMPDGHYKIQFQCDINIFDGVTIYFEMQSHELVVFESVWLNAPYGQDFSSSDLRKEFELKILVNLIEYDSITTSKHIVERNVFCMTDPQIYTNASVLSDLRYILNVEKFDDIFTGRQNLDFIHERKVFIKRTAIFSRDIAYYLKCKTESTTPTFPELDIILNYLLHGERIKIYIPDLIKVYIKAHHLGLNFLIHLSRDCILNRFTDYQIFDIREYEQCIFQVLKAAVHVNDESLFEKVVIKLNTSQEFFDSANLARFEPPSIETRFMTLFSQRRLKNLKSNSRIGIGESSSSK